MSRVLFSLLIALHLWTYLGNCAPAQDSVLPPGDTSPVLRLETNGPRSYVSGLAFSPDGQHLYATGWDKAVQVWNLQKDHYAYSSGATLRVPTGAGPFGELNGLALSTNGVWLAAAGQGQPREVPGERTYGWVLPASNISQISQLDNGMIYVFNTKTRETRLLRGHRGPVQALTFVQNSPFDAPQLISVAEEHAEGSGETQCRVRCWDISTGNEVASLGAVPALDGKTWGPLPSLKGFRPGLTAWSSGKNLNQARVALAWGDDQFRVWDVETGQVASARSNPNILTVVPVTNAFDKLLTGAHAEMGVWTMPRSETGRLASITRQQFESARVDSVNGKNQNLPSAATLIPGTNGQPTRVAFVVTRYLENGGGEYRLLITSAKSPIELVKEVELPWRGEVRQPAIAASADGKRLAVSGNQRNEIELYQVEDLLRGRNVPQQTLGSVGLAFQEAMFVRSGDAWGLGLTTVRRDQAGHFPKDALVFDINQRRIEPSTEMWLPAITTMPGWTADATVPGKLSIKRADLPPIELDLIDNHTATGYAFCPPTPHCPIPLVAVASHVRGQPLLQLFNGETGETLRWCVGHTERIRSLSFSEDGRMLVTVGSDRTVCVWTTTDLAERNLGKHGRLPGVTVHKIDRKLFVTNAPLGSALQRGDELVSATNNGEVAEIETAKDFYKYVLERRPGDTVEFTVRRKDAMHPIAVSVGQAIDESKPLFTLFVVPGEKNQDWEWIGWSPLGNFDTRGDRVDHWLGWHFNTGEPLHPAKFAAIGEYRDAFYRRDLLKTLFEHQKLPPAPVIQEDPKVSIWLRRNDGTPLSTDYDDVAQIEASDMRVIADVSGVADRLIQSLTVILDDADSISLTRVEGASEWSADLSHVHWQRGLHRLTVRLKTSNKEVTAVERAHFHPAPPKIEWEPNPKWRREFEPAEVMVKAKVIPSTEPVRVQLLLQRPGEAEPEIVQNWETNEPLVIEKKIEVDPGENRLELVTWNATAPEDVVAAETARVPTFVRRATPPMAPRIAIDEVTVLSENGEPKALTAEHDIYQSQLPRVRIRGQIIGQALIGRATLVVGETKRDLTGFTAGSGRDFKFDETITLQPGRQAVVIQSAIAAEQDEKRLTLVYEPPAPRIAALTPTVAVIRELPPSADARPRVYVQGFHEQVATISAKLEAPLDQPYRVTLRVNDVPVANEMIQIDCTQAGQHLLKAKLPLAGGKNVISLRVDNEWTRQPHQQNVDLEFRRPPEIVEIVAADKLVEMPLDLSCRIRSAIPLRNTRIVVDDRDEVPAAFAPVADSKDEYVLRAEQIGLAEGVHSLKIMATNDEGTVIEPGIHKVTIEKQSAKPPILKIVGPVSTEAASIVSSKRFEIQYQVTSTVPTTIQLKNRGTETTISSDAVPVDGSNATIPLDLWEGVNDIELIAFNSGGFSAKQILRVSYVAPAATVEIISVDDQRPQIGNNGTGHFAKRASKSRVNLLGRIKSKERLDPNQPLKARIWVNSFKLPTVDVVVDRENPTIGKFGTDLTLSMLTNSIKVQVYGEEGHVASEIGCTNTLTIDCEKPERRQELYLVLLGTGDQEGSRQGAQRFLKATPKTKVDGTQEIWESDAFSQIHVFDATNVNPSTAQHRMLKLVRTMNGNFAKNASKGGSQAIVMVYFEGKIEVSSDDFSFITSETQLPSDRAMTGRILESNLTNSYGAHIVFMDLTQNTNNLSESDIWPKAPNLGILVRNWKGQGKQPDQTKLSTALEQTLPQVRKVSQLSASIDEQYQRAKKIFREQLESVDRLQVLQDAPFGAGALE
ncbi:WD40 repeat domain-containing protein [Schlesneria paludicola]|uniref:WD40 repeat domain-containing protein n=1 Tax=Schlesneria paludicola TaxID=360056 RepID=UPI00029B56FC|nr:[myosin heavy-chain] kinase [Schlesneria paludicola]